MPPRIVRPLRAHLPWIPFLLLTLAACGTPADMPAPEPAVMNSPASGTASRVFLEASLDRPVTEATAQQTAEEVLARYAGTLKGSATNDAVFRTDPAAPSQLAHVSTVVHPASDGMPERYTVTFDQHHAGVPVEGTNAFVTLAADGSILGMGADVFPDLAIDVRPRLTAVQAAQAALRAGARVTAAELTLSILPPGRPGEPARLVWAGAPSTGIFGMIPERIVVDATTGAIDRVEIVHTAVLRATVPQDKPGGPMQQAPLPGARVRAGTVDVVTGTDGSFSGATPYTTRLESAVVDTYLYNECGTTCSSTLRLDGTGDLLWQANDTATLGKLITHRAILAGRSAAEGWGYSAFSAKTLNVNRIPESTSGSQIIHCNATWSPTSLPGYGSLILMYLTGSDDPRGCLIPKDIETYSDVAFHEYGHGLFYSTYDPFTYPNPQTATTQAARDAAMEAQAISEGFGDLYACIMNNEATVDPLGGARTCTSTAQYSQLLSLCGNNPACHNGAPLYSTPLYQASIASGADRDALMRGVFAAMAQRPMTIPAWGEAVLASVTHTGTKDALRASYAARGITLSGSGGGGPVCGNGVKETGEECDGTSFGAATCSTATGGERPQGSLSCTNSCTISTLSCTAASSGGGTLGPGTGGSGGPGAGTHTVSLSEGSYLLHVPASYTQSEPARLVIALGGSGGTATMTIDSGWKTVADRDGALVFSITPASGGGYATPELDLLVAAYLDVTEKYNVAINHISLWGFSAGAHLTYALGLGAQNSQVFNALGVQAGSIEPVSTQVGVWPPQAGARRIPVFASTGTLDTACGGGATSCGGGLIGALRRDVQALQDAGYPVQSREVAGLGHTYGSAEVEAAWTFLKAQTLDTPALAACTTNGCAQMGATQCSGTQVQTCQQTTQGTGSCLAWSTAVACTDGQTCQADACTASSGAPVCGNGILEPGEECDDGNTTAGDLCSPSCKVERPGPTPVAARIARPVTAQPTGTPTVFDCRPSLGYRLACGWDFGDGTDSLGRADYTGDGVVDIEDLRFFVRSVYHEGNRTTPPAGTVFDLNGDGRVDVADAQRILLLSTTHSAAHTYTAAGVYTVRLTVSGTSPDGSTVRSSETETVTIAGTGGTLVARATADAVQVDGQTVTLLGSVQGGEAPYEFAWTQTGGPSVDVRDHAKPAAQVDLPRDATTPMVFAFSVRDSTGATARSVVTVTPPGAGVDVCVDLPPGRQMGALVLNTPEFSAVPRVKAVTPVGDPYDTDTLPGVIETYLQTTSEDASVDQQRRFVVGYGRGATAALLAGALHAGELAGVVHVNADTLGTCATSDATCAQVQEIIRNALDAMPRRVPVAVVSRTGTTQGDALVQELRARGYAEGIDLLVLRTAAQEPSAAERLRIAQWMLSVPADDACRTSPPVSWWRTWLLPTAHAVAIGQENCAPGFPCSDDLRPASPVATDRLGQLGMDRIAGWMAGIVASLAVLYTMWGGVQYMAAGGDLERQAQAKRTIVYSLVGVAMTVLSYAIVMALLRATYSA